MNKNTLNPITFIKGSFDYMQGTPKWKIWLYMPIAYCKFCYYMITGK